MKTSRRDMTIGGLVQAHESANLAPNPEYQRGERWTDQQQRWFVDSVFRSKRADYPSIAAPGGWGPRFELLNSAADGRFGVWTSNRITYALKAKYTAPTMKR
jgi:hypothetical protein